MSPVEPNVRDKTFVMRYQAEIMYEACRLMLARPLPPGQYDFSLEDVQSMANLLAARFGWAQVDLEGARVRPEP